MKKLLILILLFSCCTKEIQSPEIPESGYTTYTIDKGDHNSTPATVKIYNKDCEISGKFYFNYNSIYNLNSVDQFDWNKLVGYKLDLNNVPSHAAMIGWRYNTDYHTFQICPYFNNNGIVFPNESEIIDINVFEPVNFYIQHKGENGTIKLWNKDFKIEKTVKLKKAGLFSRVHPWFGGNQEAPNKVELYLKID
jgi:hypothetical protein